MYLSKIPSEPHYAILMEDKIQVDDTYGNLTTESRLTYTSFQFRDEWESEIRALKSVNAEFRALYVNPAVIATEVKVDIKL